MYDNKENLNVYREQATALGLAVALLLPKGRLQEESILKFSTWLWHQPFLREEINTDIVQDNVYVVSSQKSASAGGVA